jgi:hypothetical protein
MYYLFFIRASLLIFWLYPAMSGNGMFSENKFVTSLINYCILNDISDALVSSVQCMLSLIPFNKINKIFLLYIVSRLD